MLNENPVLNFKDFSPSEFTKNYLRNKFSGLLEEAPYDSVLKVTYKKEKDFYTGLLVICAKRGKKFVTVGLGESIKDVTQEMMTQIRQQLKSWKARRFNNEVSYGETGMA